MLGGWGRVRVVGDERNPDVRLDVSGQHRQHLASQLRGLDLHVLVQRRVALHLSDDRTARYVLFVLPGGPVGLSGNAQGAPAALRQFRSVGGSQRARRHRPFPS